MLLCWKFGQKPYESSGSKPHLEIFSRRLSASSVPVCLTTRALRGQRSFSTFSLPPLPAAAGASPIPGAITGCGQWPFLSISVA